MWVDPIVEEVRRVRERQAAEFGPNPTLRSRSLRQLAVRLGEDLE